MPTNKTILFCIPFSGGNSYSFSGFKKYFPHNIEIVTLELPGHGKRIAEPLLNNIDDMTEDLYNQIKNKISKTYAIFGHSLGSLLGYSLAKLISKKNENEPIMLFLSGHTAPSIAKPQKKSSLSDDKFIDMLREMQGTPEELLSDKSFIQYFLPVIRADFYAAENYIYKPETSPLDVLINVLYGNEEDFSEAEARLWQLETTKEITINCFNGGHFFILDHTQDICNFIINRLNNNQ